MGSWSWLSKDGQAVETTISSHGRHSIQICQGVFGASLNCNISTGDDITPQSNNTAEDSFVAVWLRKQLSPFEEDVLKHAAGSMFGGKFLYSYGSLILIVS